MRARSLAISPTSCSARPTARSKRSTASPKAKRRARPPKSCATTPTPMRERCSSRLPISRTLPPNAAPPIFRRVAAARRRDRRTR